MIDDICCNFRNGVLIQLRGTLPISLIMHLDQEHERAMHSQMQVYKFQ